MPDDGELVNILVAIIAAFAILFVGIALLDSGTDNPEGTAVEEHARLADEGEWVHIDHGDLGRDQTVFDSRGNAIRLTGADDSFVESDQSIEFATDANWTVSTWANVSDGAGSKNMTAVSLNGRVLLQYNGSQSNWSVWYFDEGSRDSWRANVSAPNQPGNFTLITAQHNGTHLTIYRNQTQGDVVNTSAGDNIEPVWINATNWEGDLDETRTWDANITDAQRNALFNNPIDPVVNSRTARLYYDQGTGTEVLVFHAGGTATLSNGSWVDGLAGKTLDEKTGPADVVGGNDYEWDEEGPRIKPRSGGELEDQPVAWVDYTRFDQTARFAFTALDAWGFAATVPMIILGLFVLGLLLRYRATG